MSRLAAMTAEIETGRLRPAPLAAAAAPRPSPPVRETLAAVSHAQTGPGGQVQIEILPPIQTSDRLGRLATDLYDWVVGLLPPGRKLSVYHEAADQRASDYPEVAEALTGEVAEQVRDDGDGGLVLSVA